MSSTSTGGSMKVPGPRPTCATRLRTSMPKRPEPKGISLLKFSQQVTRTCVGRTQSGGTLNRTSVSATSPARGMRRITESRARWPTAQVTARCRGTRRRTRTGALVAPSASTTPYTCWVGACSLLCSPAGCRSACPAGGAILRTEPGWWRDSGKG